METTAILPRLQGVKKSGNGWTAKCPAHDDGTASLSITQGDDGRTLLHCHAGCTPDAVCAASGLKLSDLFADNGHAKRNGSPARIVATYPYHDASGNMLFEVVRFEPKDFRQRKPDATAPDGWTWNTKSVEKVLFRLPETLRDVQTGKFIFLCEGEKDVLKMASHGFSATCNPGGAGKWQDSFSETLRGADVVIIADKDKAGRDHAQLVASKLHGGAKSVLVIELPDVNGATVKDAHDYFVAGGTFENLIALVDSAPTWTPAIKIESDVASEPDADVRGEIVSILTNGKLTQTEQRTQIANAVVSALAARGKFFFHAERKDFDSAMYFDNSRKQLLRICSDAFSAWLAEWVCINRADAIYKFIIAQVETVALAGSQTVGIVPESFWASRTGAIYLSNGDGSIAKITAGKVAIVDNGADGILFAAGNTLAAWTITEPQNPFETCSLFSGANCAASHGLDLLRLWILSLATNPASKPPVCFAGDIGSGKTRLAKGVAELYGLPFIANKVEDFGEDNFWVSLDAGGLFTLDNVDTRNKWLPDAVASASTDGCKQKRKLYTNAENITLRARAWLALTTANPTFANDAGLSDRLLLVRMNRRTDETGDAKLSDEIREHRNASLSYIARTLATALADTQRTPAGLNQRHPDFAAFAVRIGRAIGRETESVHALKSAEQDKSIFCVENDSIGAALLAYLRTAELFTGTASELVTKLVEIDPELSAVKPLSARKLGKRFSALWPHLEKVLATAKQEKDRNHFTIYTLKSKSADYAEFQTPI